VFNPLCAFQGGVVAQECIKAITNKFTPIHQAFYYDALEVLPEFNPAIHLESAEQANYFEEKYVKEIIKTGEINHRSDGLRIVLGDDMVNKLAHTKLFMVGAGAIGCELLKNYAMLGVGVGKANPKKKI
jgi:molybdopterin/thiamine biosynthesis adenylyltransferase